MEITERKMESPIGPLRLAASDVGLCRVSFSEEDSRRELSRRFGEIVLADTPHRRALLERARTMLDRYFTGDREEFAGLPLDPGGTDFQKEVWQCLRTIPRGETRSYGEIAAAVHRPSAVRAVGSANRSNPIAIIVPCHRVIGRDGALRGYAGRLDRKEWLLRHEGAAGAFLSLPLPPPARMEKR